MSDPINPIAPAAQEPAQGTPAAAVAQPPANAAAAPQAPAAPAAKPPYVNPWQGRAPAPVAPAAAASAQPPAPPAASPASDPLASLRADVEGLRGIIGRTVEQDLTAVPANVAAAVRAASADPIEQRRLLDVMRANGLASPQPAAPAPLPPPANTMPAAAPPAAPVEPVGDAAVLAEFQRLKSRGAHITASAFYASNAGAIERALKSSSPSN